MMIDRRVAAMSQNDAARRLSTPRISRNNECLRRGCMIIARPGVTVTYSLYSGPAGALTCPPAASPDRQRGSSTDGD